MNSITHFPSAALADSPATVANLIAGLNSLRDGDTCVNRLLASGAEAVEPLRHFLLDEPPRTIFEPRCRAVEALAGLGAKQVLVEYLEHAQTDFIEDPVVRHSERAVQNAAIRELAAWRTEDVFQLLIRLIKQYPFASAAQALGYFGRPEAVPYLIEALSDDVCRSAAMESLRWLRNFAIPQLLDAAMSRQNAPAALETPSNIRVRRAALRLLADASLSCDQVIWLRSLLPDRDPESILAVSQILARYPELQDGRELSERLKAILPKAGWYLTSEIRELLIQLQRRPGEE